MRKTRIRQHTTFHRGFALLLCAAIVPVPPVHAQDRPGSGAAPDQQNTGLKVVVLEGENAINNIRTRTAVQPVVEVRDSDDRPLSGATVTFHLPALGAGATFPGGQLEQEAVTNTQGQASTTGLSPNSVAGRYRMRVTARRGLETGSATVTQENMEIVPVQQKASSGLWKYLLILGAAGGAAGALALTAGGSSSASPAATPATLTIVPGSISIGGPR